MNEEIQQISKYFVIFVIGLTVIFGISLFWKINEESEAAHEYAKIEAQASYNKDLLYRRWAAMHGGVYVPATDTTPPNPHLSFIPERDIFGFGEKKLTLVNPAYMTRQVFELGEEQYGVKGHITSLNPIRPQNKPDSWETHALQLFEKNQTEYWSNETIDGKEYLRYMHAMVVEKRCMKCHAQQGYQIGEVRGGISVSVPVDKYRRIAVHKTHISILSHLIFYCLILLFSGVFFKRYKNELIRRSRMQYKIAESESRLQVQNKEYALLNQELLKAKDKAEESDRLKTAFLQNMSHEIRTPMNAIVGFAELMNKDFSDKAKLQYYSNIISERSQDLLVIINDILDIAKIEAGQITVTIECFNLQNLLMGIRNFFHEQQEKLKKQHIYFDIKNDCDITDINIVTDKTKLRQILINLISNAFKFTNEGSIVFGCRKDENDRLTFYVSDTGTGIPVDKHQFIFKRFAQLPKDGNTTYKGTGLGLPIAKALVSLLGGNLTLQSEPGKGTTFTFSINYNVQALENKTVEMPVQQTKFDFSQKTILVVEDDHFNAELIREIILPSGAKIIIAENGKEAIGMALQHNPDLILMDINLPDISGYKAVEQILKEKPSMKIIVQTAYASIDDQKEAILKGCVDYISKPIKTQKLLALINRCFNCSEA